MVKIISKIKNGLIAYTATVWQYLYLLLLQNYGFPQLLYRWPMTVKRLYQVLLGSGSHAFYALTSYDYVVRSYYDKLAFNFTHFGRFGYTWDEVFGTPMGVRFYANSATYYLYGWLSPRLFRIAVLASYIVCTALAGFLFHASWLTLAVLLLSLGSPAILFSFVSYQVKPETLWWPLSIPALVAAVHHQWLLVCGILSFIVLVNTSVALITAFLLSSLWVWSLITHHWMAVWALPLLLPGVIKYLFRYLYSYRRRFSKILTEDQKRLAKNFAQFKKDSIDFLKTYAVYLLLASWWIWPAGMGLILTAGLFYFYNRFYMKIADFVTVRSVFICSVTALSIASGSWLSLIGVWMFLYGNPLQFALSPLHTFNRFKAINQERFQAWNGPFEQRIRFYHTLYRAYPWFTPTAFLFPEAMKKFFEFIPNGSRIVIESRGDPRTESVPLWNLRNWTNAFLPERQIEFLNQTPLVKGFNPELAKCLDYFAAPPYPGIALRNLSLRLGIGYILAYTQQTVQALLENGFKPVCKLDKRFYWELQDIFHIQQPFDLFLLQTPSPESAGVLFPPTPWKRDGNSFTWEARKGQLYELRYNYQPEFEARQSQGPLPIDKIEAIPGSSLYFMRITAAADGPLTVRFRSKWI